MEVKPPLDLVSEECAAMSDATSETPPAKSPPPDKPKTYPKVVTFVTSKEVRLSYLSLREVLIIIYDCNKTFRSIQVLVSNES